MSTKQKYDQSFKTEAVKLAISSGKPVVDTARSLNIKEVTLHNWIRNAKIKDKNTDTPIETLDLKDLHLEINRLRKDNKRLQDTCEILKKATAYFANEK